jgi:hypothetical protein
MEGSEQGSYDWQADPTLPTPTGEGYTMGSNACLDQCWQQFYACLDRSMNPMECIAQLEVCKRNCAQQVTPLTCDQSCPTCASERQLTNPCTQPMGHGASHQCSYGDTW